MKNILFIAAANILLFSCKPTQELPTQQKVELEQYMGKWYEIARFPNRFEKNLTCVTATYSLKENGKVKVVNEGYNTQKEKWEQAIGEAKRPNAEVEGELKVSFFKPFYGDYYILKVNENYTQALVGSPTRDYLWILSKTKTMETDTYSSFLDLAKSQGFEINRLEKIAHNCKK